MIVADDGDRYRFVTQPEHARLAGLFAARWGNETFDRPEPLTPSLIAADTHDNGWWEYDLYPRLGDDGSPVGVADVPADAWTAIYETGIANAVEIDPYAGLLVSMHGTGLRRRRYGLAPSLPDRAAEFAGFIDREEARQRELLDQLRSSGRYRDHGWSADERLLAALHDEGEPPDGHGSPLWLDYRLLQAWDTLSLSLCRDYDRGRGTLDTVPVGTGDRDVSVEHTALEDGEHRLDPYPFDESPVRTTVHARAVPKSAFGGTHDLTEAYFRGEHVAQPVTLRR